MGEFVCVEQCTRTLTRTQPADYGFECSSGFLAIRIRGHAQHGLMIFQGAAAMGELGLQMPKLPCLLHDAFSNKQDARERSSSTRFSTWLSG